MIENCIGIISLPLGLGLNFTINDKKFQIPMATEEPSVIAAASSAAKLISKNNGFNCYYNNKPYMITQIHYENPFYLNEIESKKYLNNIKNTLKTNKKNIISHCNKNICNKMFLRGGGVKNISIRIISNQFFILEIIVNTCESMGANLLTKISEELSKFLYNKNIIKIKPLMCILSNFSIYKTFTSEFKIKTSDLKYNEIDGKKIAEKIIKSIEIAKFDVFRACTNNKGIMNGIEAVAIALGQDVRAIEAGIHVYACVEINEENVFYSNYKPLSSYKIITENNESFLFGTLTVPLCIGTVGGAINSNEIYRNNFQILNNPNCEWLGYIMCAVGLAQNFAALRKLVTEGINKGHFNLHAKNVAIRAGVPDDFVKDAVDFMVKKNGINEENAKEFLMNVKK